MSGRLYEIDGVCRAESRYISMTEFKHQYYWGSMAVVLIKLSWSETSAVIPKSGFLRTVIKSSTSLATSESWTDRSSGERREKTEWHRVVIFNDRLAEVGKISKQRIKVYLEGQLQTRKWTGNDGVEKYTTKSFSTGSGELTMLDPVAPAAETMAVVMNPSTSLRTHRAL